MKISKILFCIVVTVIYVHAKDEYDDEEHLKSCRREIGYPDSFYPSYNPIERKEKCFIACMMEKDGMMVDGKLVLLEIIRHFENYPDGQNTKKKAVFCIEEANKKHDKCEVAAAMIKCFEKTGKQSSRKKN